MTNTETLFIAIKTYFDAIYFCDANLLDQVFHKGSSLFDSDENKVFIEPVASFRADVATRTSPASCDQPREEEVITIDWLSANCAVVKVRLKAHRNIFVDHLNFVYAPDQGWKIVAKIWHLESVRDTV